MCMRVHSFPGELEADKENSRNNNETFESLAPVTCIDSAPWALVLYLS